MSLKKKLRLDYFECCKCQRRFTNKSSLKRHLTVFHVELYGVDKEDEHPNLVVCEKCDKKFKRKDTLLRHIQSCQSKPVKDSPKIYRCEVCSIEYSKKESLNTHVKRKHSFKKTMRCAACDAKFTGSSCHAELRKHLKEFHPKLNIGNLKCILCEHTFLKKAEIWHHVVEEHEIEIDHHHLQFETVAEFFEWKRNTEKSTTTVFRKSRGTKSKGQYKETCFSCHRSGSYTPISERKRRIKLQGSKKIGGYCPAEISLYENIFNGKCRVSYVSTHIGHKICDEDELAHMYLTKEERLEIAAQISQGVPYNKILTSIVGTSASSTTFDPLRLLNRKDLSNISQSYNVKPKPDDPVIKEQFDIEAFITQYHKSILFYKREGEMNENVASLRKNDVIIIIMTETQEKMLIKFGHNVIAVDGTFGTTTDNFILHTILVLDNYHEGIPVAFAISNRNDHLLADVFLNCLKKKIGILETKSFMCDIRLHYFKSWEKIMGPVNFRLFCKWPESEAWRHSLKRIINPEKRKQMRTRLHEISMFREKERFQESIKSLIEDTDPELKDFLNFFETRYCESVQKWAYCYRKNLGLNTNTHAQAFHHALDLFFRKRKKAKTLSSCLTLLNDYFSVRETQLRRKKIRGTISGKLQELRRRHDVFEKESVSIIVESTNIPDEGWCVSVSHSDSESAEVYFVRENDDYCYDCKLYCEKCEACMNKYQCTCIDNAIKNYMCEHIHGLCIFLKFKEQETNSTRDSHEISVIAEDISDDELLSVVKLPVTDIEGKTDIKVVEMY